MRCTIFDNESASWVAVAGLINPLIDHSLLADGSITSLEGILKSALSASTRGFNYYSGYWSGHSGGVHIIMFREVYTAGSYDKCSGIVYEIQGNVYMFTADISETDGITALKVSSSISLS